MGDETLKYILYILNYQMYSMLHLKHLRYGFFFANLIDIMIEYQSVLLISFKKELRELNNFCNW